VGREGAKFCPVCGSTIGVSKQETDVQSASLKAKGTSPEQLNGAKDSHTAQEPSSILEQIRKELNLAPPYVPKKKKKARK
jgi:uncharacterized Zn finger protein (UPF0148 family)